MAAIKVYKLVGTRQVVDAADGGDVGQAVFRIADHPAGSQIDEVHVEAEGGHGSAIAIRNV